MATQRMRAARIGAGIICCLLLAAVTNAHADDNKKDKTPDPFAKVRARIQKHVVEAKTPSIAVAVAQNGKILWEEAFGWADREKKIRATVNTMYCQASVSKPITATGLMVLVDRGKLNLDAPANRYLPKDSQLRVWIGDPKDVTLRRIASHTAGLPRHDHFYRAPELHLKPPMTESIRRYGNIVRMPGERYRYSNFGYGILDYVIGRTSNSSFAEFMRSEVFLPLGMTHTSVNIDPRLKKFAAARYDAAGRAIPFYSCDHIGASGIYSSVHDMVRFGMFHLGQLGPDGKAVLSDKTRAAMYEPLVPMDYVAPENVKSYSGTHYGIGWVIVDGALGKSIQHTGGMDGVSSRINLMPAEGIVVVIVANQFRGLPWWIEREILSVVLPDYQKKANAYWEKRRKNRKARDKTKSEDKKQFSELLGDWQGHVYTYEGNVPLVLSFKESGKVYAQLGKQPRAVVNNMEFVHGWLTGKTSGRIKTKDTERYGRSSFRNLDLELTLRGEVLNGAVTSTPGNSLSYWVQLRRKPAAGSTGQADAKVLPGQNNKVVD